MWIAFCFQYSGLQCTVETCPNSFQGCSQQFSKIYNYNYWMYMQYIHLLINNWNNSDCQWYSIAGKIIIISCMFVVFSKAALFCNFIIVGKFCHSLPCINAILHSYSLDTCVKKWASLWGFVNSVLSKFLIVLITSYQNQNDNHPKLHLLTDNYKK